MKKNQTMFNIGLLLISASVPTLCFSSIAAAVAQSDYEDEYGMSDMGGMGGMEPMPSPLERQIEYLKKARTDEQKETVKQRIRKELVQQYDAYLAASSDELKSLEARLVKLRAKLVVREEAKEKMIDLELQRIVNETEGLAWPKKMNQRRSSSGFGGMGSNSGGYETFVRTQPVQPSASPRNEILRGLIESLAQAEAKTKPKSPPRALSNDEKEKTKNDLRQIGLSAHSFENQHKHFPRNIEDEIGTPLLSWRVAILPYVGEKELYEKFHLDEAWDSPHNKELLSQMPSIYGPKSVDGKTDILGIADSGSIFEPGIEVGFGDITDGTSNTILCVASNDEYQSRFWTQPSDLTIDQLYLVAVQGNLIVSICDGSVAELDEYILQADLRHLATRNDGEVVTAHVDNK